MAEAWHISRSTRMCSASDTPLEPGQPYFSALVEDGEGFMRRDFSMTAWPEVDKTGFFSYWKNKGWNPKNDGKAKPIDYERLLAFFDDLANAVEPHRRLFRYVVGLMLSRRRVLRLDSVKKGEDGDFLELYDRRNQTTLEVLAPQATADQLKEVQNKLNELFDIDGEESGD